jgi:hypothetical protein
MPAPLCLFSHRFLWNSRRIPSCPLLRFLRSLRKSSPFACGFPSRACRVFARLSGLEFQPPPGGWAPRQSSIMKVWIFRIRQASPQARRFFQNCWSAPNHGQQGNRRRRSDEHVGAHRRERAKSRQTRSGRRASGSADHLLAGALPHTLLSSAEECQQSCAV